MFADYHVHTEFSNDSDYPMEQVVKDAIAMRMDEICFTDHVDYGVKDDWDCGHAIRYDRGEPLINVNYPKYAASIQRLREQYGTQITLRMGMEFGMQVHTIPQFEALFHRYPFDFILLSVHQADDKEFWSQDFQKGKSQQEYNERYYQELLAVVREYHNYSVLGHLDLIVRYDQCGIYPFENVKPVVSQILEAAIADGKGIEFNTSCHRYGLSDTTPSVEILRLYRSMGGEIITIGSDSHAPAHLGSYIREAKQLLKSLGYRYFCTYEQMRPVFHSL